MESVIIVTSKEEIKKCLKEVLIEYFNEIRDNPKSQLISEPLLSRKEIVKHLDDISLVTLHTWVKNGLPCHKQGGRVYFLKSEVLEFIRKKNL